MFNQKLIYRVLKNLLQFIFIPALMLMSMHAFADGTDLLQGTDANLISTIKGTGKTYLYLAEIVVACAGYVKTRNPMIFLGILVLAVGFNVLLKIAGV